MNTYGELYHITNEKDILNINNVKQNSPCIVFFDMKFPDWFIVFLFKYLYYLPYKI